VAVENPEHWPEAQRRFHLAYLEDPAAFPRRPVGLVWVTRHQTRWSLDVVTGRHVGVEVTVTDVDGHGRSMRFAVSSDTSPPRLGGEDTGFLVGGWGANATCCVEVDGGVVWPAYNPVEIDDRAAWSARSRARQQRGTRTPSTTWVPPERWLRLPRLVRGVLVAAVATVAVTMMWVRGARVSGHPVTWARPPFYAGAMLVVIVLSFFLRDDSEPPSGS
jgi:hypothetical protein